MISVSRTHGEGFNDDTKAAGFLIGTLDRGTSRSSTSKYRNKTSIPLLRRSPFAHQVLHNYKGHL